METAGRGTVPAVLLYPERDQSIGFIGSAMLERENKC